MKSFRKLKKQLQFAGTGDGFFREGSSFVTVIIGIAFLLAIGLVVLTVSTRYLSSVVVDKNSTEQFYESESILEEVKTGVAQYANEAADDAYTYLMNHYSQQTKENKKTLFAKMYLTLIGKKLKAESLVSPDKEEFGTYFWRTDDAAADTAEKKQAYFFETFDAVYLSTEAAPKIQHCGSAESNLNQIRKLSAKHSDAVKLQGSNTEYVYTIEKDDTRGYYLTIKNILIDYKNSAGYQSTIQADIVLTVPDYKLSGDSTLAQIKDYVSISDDSLTVDSRTMSGTVTGNIYAGLNSNSTTNQGIKVSQGAKDVSFRSQRIISRGSLDVLPGASLTVTDENGTGNGEMWLENIRMTYDGGNSESMQDETKFSVNANSYIANDLDIATDNASVTLMGKYYGYSYSENNKSTDAQYSDYSSAILVNGRNTLLKTDNNLSKLILAGRTFVSRNTKNADGSIAHSSSSDIMMGESLAVKSNQLAYLVPDKYIQIVKNGVAEEGHNPVMFAEESDVQIITKSENGKSGLLDDYPGLLNTTQPYTADYSNTGSYVFYYLNFKDTASANEYFSKYYASSDQDEENVQVDNTTLLKNRAEVYISNQDTDGLKIAPSLYLIAGNIVDQYKKSIDLKESNYYKNDGTPKEELLNDGYQQGSEYVGLMTTLVPGRTTGAMRLSDMEKKEEAGLLVAGQIINNAKLTTAKTVNVPTSFTGGMNGVKIQLIPAGTSDGAGSDGASVTIDKGLVIAGKGVNVKVTKDFTGLILSSGKVTMAASAPTMTADPVMVDQILSYIKTDKELSQLFYGFSGILTENPTEIKDCVSYENWKKNEVQP